MCGIAGYTTFNAEPATKASLEKMGEAIIHRGPDAGNVYYDENIGLCHRRLAIIDLSEAGVQPMFSSDKRYVIAFNGEIYNFQEHREALINKGYTFNTHTDTEVILALFAEHGEQCVDYLNGMFAFALWDIQEQTLFIARDRLGKKPLYYYQNEGDVYFASELKSLMAINAFPKNIRTDAVYDFFAYQYIPDPKTIFENVYKLEPGHCMTVTREEVKTWQYWDVSFANVNDLTEEQNIDELTALLKQCTKNRMVSDVPLGAFLSGGVDSSGVVALMSQVANESEQANHSNTLGCHSHENGNLNHNSGVPNCHSREGGNLNGNNEDRQNQACDTHNTQSHSDEGQNPQNEPHKITTCSIGFDNEQFNETEFAQIVADKYQTDHHEFTVHQNVKDNLKHIVKFFDEPFADPSLVPTYFVSELARQKVTVAVAGDGGDEVFAGYEKYSVDYLENKLRDKFPNWMRKSLFPIGAQLAGSINAAPFKKAKSLLNTLSVDAAMGFYISNSFMTDDEWSFIVKENVSAELGDYHPSKVTIDKYQKADGKDHLSKILYTDMKTYLPGGILVKVDRMSMANSLEVRAPILDYTVVEKSASIASSSKFKVNEENPKGEKKHILKELFKPMLPNDILYRKKMGFSVPLAQWLRGEIKDIAQEKLIASTDGLINYFRRDSINQLWQEHQSGKYDHASLLWSMLMFQMWWDEYGN
ncbi:asparagine synthase (glutamine-hydrolyzing) [Thalassotalea eurytherma]|uniref:asparagine synthase (glutamine-hydrolyzing) n=1 Tax=Thalassotalea eurytherma TaxID=1144278 RepID=A0ABQ6H2H8_9GAMM|nr:asparagine synthase (glutamine-hydrolyzing) [Thalassotalea eurytherma]GLX82109.1 hypothetical protein theurythT_15610 [Thalassotalea eurytherma]